MSLLRRTGDKHAAFRASYDRPYRQIRDSRGELDLPRRLYASHDDSEAMCETARRKVIWIRVRDRTVKQDNRRRDQRGKANHCDADGADRDRTEGGRLLRVL